MTLFRVYLAAILLILAGYTLVVGANHGWNLLPIFFSDIAELSWHGQFNLDFMTFLGLSAIWVAWRHHFTAGGIVLGVVAFFGGMMFLAPYLLWASSQAGGDAKVLLLGDRRAT
ncbi:hypothetical protein F6455_02795 [Proteobacteria bacterium 005FR1]|nr:hypothetical protein [Proteobacteria bacterium 005FR1]